MKTQNKRTTIRNLSIFSGVILSIGWIGRELDVMLGNPASEGLGILLWISVPLVASLLLRAFAGDGWTDFGIRPYFKGNLHWYLVSALVYPLATLLIVIVGRASGLISIPDASWNTLWLITQAFFLALLPNLVKNFFEESAWRGYLAPKVYSLGLNDFLGHGIVGLVWGAWHIPYYLFFVDRGLLAEFTTLNMGVYIPLAIVVMLSWAFVYGEIRLLTNSIWPAVLMHAVEDSFLFALILGQYILITPGTDWLISPMNGLLCVALFMVVGFSLYRYRKQKSAFVGTDLLPTPA